MTVCCAPELSFFSSCIRSGNDSPHFPFILHGKLSGNFTVAIQIFQSHGFLIAANLKHRIRRGIDNKFSIPDFFFPQFLQNFCSTGAFVSDNGSACTLLQFFYELFWKSRLCKGLKRFRHIKSHHLPMTGHSIFSTAFFPQPHISCQGTFHRLHSMKGF